MGFFSDLSPSAFINIGSIQIFFGCGGSSGYLSSYNNPDAIDAIASIVFTDTATPCFSGGGGIPINQTALDNLTEKFGQDFLGWLQTQFDYVFIGTCNVQPNGFIDEIEFDYTANAVQTRIRSCPLNGWPHELGHDDPSCPAGTPGNNLIGIATTDITAGAGTTYGTGSVQIYLPGATSATTVGSPVTVSNWFPTTITSGSNVILVRINCQLFVAASAC